MPNLIQVKKIILDAVRDWRTFLLRDDFTTDAAAPLTTPRTAEPGPGTLTITDTNNKLSIVSGKLSFATGGVGAGNPGVWGEIRTRLAGRAILAELLVSSSGAGIEVGWDDGNSGAPYDALRIVPTVGTSLRAAGTSIDIGALSVSTTYQFAVVMRGTGFFGFIKGGAFTNWTLAWVGVTGSASMYPNAGVQSGTGVGTLDTFRVLDLPAPFTDDYGIATQRLAGAQSAGQTFTHEANCVIEFTLTTRPTGGALQFSFRIQDVSNLWFVEISTAGSMRLYERVGGANTERAVVAGVVTSGHRIVIICDGTTIRGYSNNVLRWTYSSASNFVTATAGELNALGTDGAVSDIISWPRTLASAPTALLDAAIA